MSVVSYPETPTRYEITAARRTDSFRIKLLTNIYELLVRDVSCQKWDINITSPLSVVGCIDSDLLLDS